ncbi:hypothetical protein LFL96_32310 [Paraburkholderia sp. D15]|uniref:hypothetical protein n=1 Tax=Paraburkholderia sp. D15 TaxID=2880218 RepID=UPI00247A12A9|nr:hypothetical protein [Paraburkholderia sp. D15]WGS52858.1 hypothetical protein LFL96_32310 [Paraburkholderia sp. D15]WKF61720.1 hypothetical protein HUO10_006252 [Paraburkholderia busanensis]
MFTFIIVVAVAAFVPYVAAPGIANGVKAINKPPAATTQMQFETTPATTPQNGDATNRLVSGRRDNEAAS